MNLPLSSIVPYESMNLPRSLALLLSFACIVSAPAATLPQALAEKWVAQVAGSLGLSDIPSAVATDAAGDVYVSGHVGVTAYLYKATVAKLDGSTGALLWRWESERSRGGDTGTVVTTRYSRVEVGPDGNPVVLFNDEQLMKFRSSDGTVLWAKWQEFETVGGVQLVLDSSGDAIVAGSGGYAGKGFAAKYRASDGLRFWTFNPVGLGGILRTVKADAAGDLFVAGDIRPTSGGATQVYTAKLSGSNGQPVWTATAPASGTSSQGARLLVLDDSGGVTIATYGGQLLRYRASDGALPWQTSNLGSPYGLTTDAAGNVYLASGGSTAYGSVSPSGIRKLNGATGAIQWTSSSTVGFVMNLALRGSELLAMGGNGANLQLSALDPQTGALRWFQPYDSGGLDMATTYNRALTLMASQPDGGVVISGVSAAPNSVYLDIVTLRYAPGPSVTSPATQWVLRTSARLTLRGSGNGALGTYYWEYGPTTAYGSSTQTQNLAVTPVLVSHAFTIEGLEENTLYHARAVAVGANGTTVSRDITFTTGWDANADDLPDEWELAEWGNTSRRLTTGDDDRDGLSNLLEYALGRRPRIPDAADATPVVLEDGHLSVTLTKRPFVSLSVEVSGDLKKWSPATVVLETSKTLKASDSFPPPGATSRFIRVLATPQ
jgi:hypothetical protein